MIGAGYGQVVRLDVRLRAILKQHAYRTLYRLCVAVTLYLAYWVLRGDHHRIELLNTLRKHAHGACEVHLALIAYFL